MQSFATNVLTAIRGSRDQLMSRRCQPVRILWNRKDESCTNECSVPFVNRCSDLCALWRFWQVDISVATNAYRRVCYYTNWSQYRQSPGKFFPENVDSSLCTHVIYAFATLNGNHLKAFEWNDESTSWSTGMYERFNAMKSQNPSVKTMIAVGGWNLGSAPFTRIAASDQSRTDFANDAVKFLRSHDFDGLDFDWEYPANRGSPAADKQNFVSLVKKTREAFDAEAQTSGKPRLLLSAATGAGKSKIETAYDLPQLVKYLDMINLMTYDLHGAFEDHTGHNSPLKAGPMDTGNDTTLNVEWAAKEYVKRGTPKSMLNVGMPLYGRSFTLAGSNTDVNAPIRGAGTAGRYTGEGGILAYYEICKMIPGAQKHIIQGEEVPYIVKGDQWVGYDDEESLRKKVDFVKQEQYGGVMVWSLDMDDFSGSCGEGKYPLLHAINDELTRSAVPNSVTNAPTTSQQSMATNGPAQMTTVSQTNPPVTGEPQTNAPVTAAPQTNTPATGAPQTIAPVTASPQTNAPVSVVPQTNAPVTATPQTNAPVSGAPQTNAPVTAAPQTNTAATGAPQTIAPVTASPQTNAPVSVVPQTNAPVTATPQTNAPVSGVPQTNAPVTAAPQTNAPVSGVPQTNAPVTATPQTNAPVSGVPQTNAPVTAAPQTNVPVTGAPQTNAPVTATPQTNAPVSGVPQTNAPVTAAPQTNVPVTGAPQTNAPVTATPQTNAPVSSVPHTNAPVTAAPQTNVPVTGAPQTNAPVTATPQTNAPVSGVPQTNAPVTGAPQTNTPVTGAPQTNAPVTATLQTNSPVSGVPQTNAPVTSAPQTNAPVTGAPQTNAPITSTSKVTTSAPVAHHTVSTTNHFNCASQSAGFYPSPTDCSKYYICAGGSAFEVSCTPGLYFNANTLFCDYPSNTQCKGSMQPSSQPPALTQNPAVTMTTMSPTNAPVTTMPPQPVATNPPATNAPVSSTQASTPGPQPTHKPHRPVKFCSGKADGIHADPNDCAHFYECASGLQFHERCSPGTVFNFKTLVCDFPQHVPHCSGSGR
ncbi:probable endochitinase [Ylistrum balloti]|uniref:probable endochitinase n=1 Tax=Ylistrum balloti TaxID=509963 RepID=UPI002905C1F6|nr:probable endochitinase [Ylistrum balloti]